MVVSHNLGESKGKFYRLDQTIFIKNLDVFKKSNLISVSFYKDNLIKFWVRYFYASPKIE